MVGAAFFGDAFVASFTAPVSAGSVMGPSYPPFSSLSSVDRATDLLP